MPALKAFAERLRWLMPLLAAAALGLSLLPALQSYRFLPFCQGTLICFLAMAAMLRLRPLQSLCRKLDGLAAQMAQIPDPVFLALTFLYFFCLTCFLSGALFHHVPHVNDTINQYIHAKFLAAGKIVETSHPLKEFFDSGWMINDGKWFSPYSPGHVLLLAAGHVVGLPWVINPLVGALTLVALFALGKQLYGKNVAMGAVLLMCVSPFVVFMSSEYMNHSTALLFTVLFTHYFLLAEKTRRRHHALLAGAAFGMLFITRPYTALGIALPFIAWASCSLVKSLRRHIRVYVLMAAAFSLFVAFHAWWNIKTTGDPLVTAYQYLLGPEHMPGLGKKAFNDSYDLEDAKKILKMRLDSMNYMLFDWAIPSLLLVVLLFVTGCFTAADALLLGVYGGLLLAYFFFQGRTEIFGPRYNYEASGSLILLTAVALSRLPRMLAMLKTAALEPTVIRGAALATVAGLVAYAFSDAIPWRYQQYGNHYWEGNYDYYEDILQNTQKPALVFIYTKPGSKPYWMGQHYFRVAFTLPPTPDSPVIFARDLGKRNTELMDYYPCRYAYMRDQNTLKLIRTPQGQCPKP